MSKRYSIADARKHLAGLVTEAESGSEVELTRRGKPVAVLISIHEYERIRGKRPAFGDVYADFLEKFDLAQIGLEEDFASDLRDQSSGRPVEI
ncbi:MAG: type II toxin-antitoxin system Phd/YefM family antitoxin [Myxococcales bacterium]|nr:type II toxin-antitoxin system Phd/YefM family antitoxin [Myxococcales bacterium]